MLAFLETELLHFLNGITTWKGNFSVYPVRPCCESTHLMTALQVSVVRDRVAASRTFTTTLSRAARNELCQARRFALHHLCHGLVCTACSRDRSSIRHDSIGKQQFWHHPCVTRPAKCYKCQGGSAYNKVQKYCHTYIVLISIWLQLGTQRASGMVSVAVNPSYGKTKKGTTHTHTQHPTRCFVHSDLAWQMQDLAEAIQELGTAPLDGQSLGHWNADNIWHHIGLTILLARIQDVISIYAETSHLVVSDEGKP